MSDVGSLLSVTQSCSQVVGHTVVLTWSSGSSLPSLCNFLAEFNPLTL